MVGFEIMITNEDFDRLYAVKNSQGFDDLSGKEFAEKLLVAELYILHPNKVEIEED